MVRHIATLKLIFHPYSNYYILPRGVGTGEAGEAAASPEIKG